MEEEPAERDSVTPDDVSEVSEGPGTGSTGIETGATTATEVDAPPVRDPGPTHVPEPDPAAPDADGFRPRHPNALKLALTGGAITIAIIAAATLLAATLLTIFGSVPHGRRALVFGLALTPPAILVFPLLLLPRLQHRRYRYRADERGLEIRKGVWWRSHRFIPRTRLQHTDVAQGPLQRYLGLASVVVHTAGTHEAETTLSGLSIETARAVREQLTGETDEEADGV